MTTTSGQGAAPQMTHTLPPLPYAFDALEPYIDAKTMEIHHDKHHAAYVTNLNKALEGNADLQKQEFVERGAAFMWGVIGAGVCLGLLAYYAGRKR